MYVPTMTMFHCDGNVWPVRNHIAYLIVNIKQSKFIFHMTFFITNVYTINTCLTVFLRYKKPCNILF